MYAFQGPGGLMVSIQQIPEADYEKFHEMGLNVRELGIKWKESLISQLPD